MRTPKQIITDMCLTWRHDYGLVKTEYEHLENPLSAGMTQPEREFLYYRMAQVYDNCIAPYMEIMYPDDLK